MVWLNDQHHNFPAAPGSFGGSKCMCAACQGHACRKCGGIMLPGKAILQTYTGTDDFTGTGSGVVTMSPGGGGILADCSKCSKCGHSVSS